jgi:hypothetical protein
LISTTNVEDINEQPPVRTTAQRREGLMGLFFEGFAQGTSEFVNEARLLVRVLSSLMGQQLSALALV